MPFAKASFDGVGLSSAQHCKVYATNRQMPSAPANQRDHRYIPRWTAATPHCATDRLEEAANHVLRLKMR
jgi:hypothetical protein